MSTSDIPQSIEAIIEGDVHGQVAVGNNILQIGSIHGGVVQFLSPGDRPNVRPRPLPVSLRPRAFRNLLDRVSEIGAAAIALEEGIPTEFFGSAGLGKTTLLKHFAHHPLGKSLTGGVVYLTARHQPLEDLLQSLYDAFYQSDIPFKPSEGDVRHALKDIRALIILDDVDLSDVDTRSLMDFAPHSRFLLASTQQRILGEGRPLALSGLPIEDSVVLLERELGRALSPAERQSASELCTALGGHPQQVLQAAAIAREERLSITVVADTVTGGLPVEVLTARYAKSLPEREQRILLLLAAMRGAPVDAAAAAAITSTPEAMTILDRLERRGLVRSDDSGYRLVPGTGEELRREWGASLIPWFKMVVAHYADWAADNKLSPATVVDRLEPQIAALEWAESNQEWASVLEQARAVEGSLALTGRWGAWKRFLDAGLRASRSLGDRAAEAWAYHELGTRALGLEEANEARKLLRKALQVRESIADQLGAAVTRQNLGMLLGVPPPPVRLPDAPSPPSPILAASSLVKTIGVVLLVAIGGAVGGLGIYAVARAMSDDPARTQVVETTPSETPTSTPTSTPVPTNTATSEPTTTATNTQTATPTASPTPSLTPSVTPTATLGPPMVTGLQDANCRFGPSTAYPVIGSLFKGQISPIDGRNTFSSWWWIDNPGGGVNCWVWDGLVALSGDLSQVPIISAPPTPTPTFTPTPSLPAPPSGLVGIWDVCGSNIVLSWVDNADNENGFRLFKNGFLRAVLSANITSFNDTSPGSSPWNYELRAFNLTGNSSGVFASAGFCIE